MIYKFSRIPFALISGFYMFKFAKPKLLAQPISEKSFTQFGEALNIDGTAFMYATGAIELCIAVTLLASLFIRNKVIALAGYLMLLGTMSGALLTEFFVRAAPVDKLVTIATCLALVSIFQLIIVCKEPQRTNLA